MKMGRRRCGRVERNTVSMMRVSRKQRHQHADAPVDGAPSQTRVLDSRSYFFMTASTSAAVPTEVSCSVRVTGSYRLLRLLFVEQAHGAPPHFEYVKCS